MTRRFAEENATLWLGDVLADELTSLVDELRATA